MTSLRIFKIVCGLYEEMLRNDENRTLGNWILAHNFLEKYFDLYFYAWIVANRDTRRSGPCALVQGNSMFAKTKAFMAVRNFLRTQ